ncbi:MAG TPA: universal stress protein [Polyangiaceae bacterium]|nr:universal stress protein [Polyangiaceae bacterium]
MKTILVGLDGSPRAAGVLSTAITIARAQQAKVHLLRSVGIPPEVPQEFWKTTDKPLIDVLRERAKVELEEQYSRVPAELRAGVEVVVGVPWQTICDRAGVERVDLVVIGSHGYGGLDRVLGTTAAKVVNHAPCSVVVVREPQRRA